MSDLLSSYGYTFQVKVITALLRNKVFLQQIHDILDPKYFESDANQWLAEQIIEYAKVYKASPTLEVLKFKIQSITHEVLQQEVIQHLKDAWRYIESDDLTFIEEKVLDFCKNQQIKKAIINSVELLKQGKYEQIKYLVDTALKSGGDKDIGHDYIANVEERYTQAVRYVKETPWEVINELTDGGLGKGELGVFVAPAGIGKCIGPNTKIDIEYEEIGIPTIGISGNEVVIWIKPWEKFNINSGFILYGFEVEALLTTPA